ncbi:hypothetical protein QYE76_044345 [Lolium multiflorum]|uniref:Retrotransposon gag domain-containing protein n=1 Tax=Lolium multiflorum TaxID=4521 RepID=A0AAD8TKS0_LOLMU|nr:hypothetical protein QYE76_044345 [Lolium multiflorum]
MAPTSSPPREDPSSEVSSIRQRQLAPTVGPEASGGRNREGSAMGSYDDSIAVGRVLYAGNFPIVRPDEFWIPARTNPVKLSIVPIGGIHIFIGETVDSDGNALVSNADASAAELDAVAKIRSESQELLKEDSALDQEKSKPTQSAPEQEKTETPSTRTRPILCRLRDPETTSLRICQKQSEIATPGQEEAGNPEESILGNLSPDSDDASSIGTEEYNRLTKELAIGEEDDGASSMNTEEFNRKLEELGGGEQAEVESAQPMQVLATVAPLDQPDTEDEASNSSPGPSNVRPPLGPQPHRDVLSPEEIVEQARMDLVAQSDILNKPITPEEAADPEALEAKRQEMLATAQKFARTAAAMAEERTLAANFVDYSLKKDREVDEMMATAKGLRLEWQKRLDSLQAEADRIAREAIPPRRITFATPTEQQPLATPKDNMKKAAELLKKKDEEIDINYVRKLVASAMQQQSKADTSRRLASNPEQCISTAQKDAIASQHRDGESRTGSTERRRIVRDHPNPIPIPSDSTPKDPAKGKDAMYTGRDKYRVPSPPPRASRPPLPPRRRSLPETPGPMGQVESTSATAPSQISFTTTQWRRRWRRRQRPEISFPLKITRWCPRDARDRLNEYRSDYIGPRCFGQMIREEPKPRSLNLKLPGNLKHYDGSERPDTWIEDYYNAVTFAGGTPNIACRMLQLYLIGPARVWLSDLEENTIFCWLDLKKAFENHFRGTYKRPATTSDLQACIQKKGETSRSFLTRWLATRNECENVDNRTAMHAFIGGLQRGGLLRHKLTLVNANKLTLDEMINIASDHTAADDDAAEISQLQPYPCTNEEKP